MRLSKVKLAGFKSFVDPTVITFPSNLVGVVGPNGCGKSNVIDAVRWVMGESSASRLRGDSITDVIFKGSSSRKPVGAATVELIFDNTETSIEGEYAKYNEISIRRVVSRDSISNYYLNGVRCRRKDITGIFLGTGLGPRSYSIIEQGMISRMIEAKPEEMRVFIEEAAGISKYKERRKETSSRIGRTKENLDRLLDVIDEIEKQINHLKRQAKTAERYKKMRQDERRFTADILAIRIRELNQNALKIEKIFMEKKVLLDSRLADQRKIEANIESQRLEHNEKMDLFNKVQANYYKVGSEISRLEQSIEYSTEIEVRQKKELEQAIQNSSEIENHISLDKEQIVDIENVLNTLEPSIINANNSESIAKELLNSAEQAIQAWQRKWDDFKSKENELTQCVTI
jgi:chromosome segregation protein